jgi:hypothetical protein
LTTFDDDAIHELVRRKQFELSAKTPFAWRSIARRLKHAADRLYDLYHDASLRIINRVLDEVRRENQASPSRAIGPKELTGQELVDAWDGELIGVYWLLMGYSIENLLKGILMAKHPGYFMTDEKMKGINTHDLPSLCDCCGIVISSAERTLLGKLQVYIVWMGKYPVPLELRKMYPIKRDDGTWENRGEAFHGRKTQEELDALWEKLEAELHKAASAS